MSGELRHTLFVSPVTPDPCGSGLQQRAFHLIRRIGKSSEVTLAVASDGEGCSVKKTSLHLAAELIVRCHRRGKNPALFLPLLVLMRRSWTSGWLVPCSVPAACSYDCVVVFRLRSHDAALALAPTARLRILDLDDLESVTLFSIAKLAVRRRRLRLALKSAAVACQYWLLEHSLLKQYDTVMLARKQDGEGLGLRADKVWFEPNRVEVPPLETRDVAAPFSLLFVGTLAYYPNADAALWIAEEIIPALRRVLPCAFRVIIAGRGADSRLRRSLSRVAEVDFRGEVSEMAPLYRAAHVFLAAVRGGGGTKVKVLEAFAHGCPVVATPHAHQGLPGTPGEALLIAGTPTQFAKHCLTLYRDPKFSRLLAALAHCQLRASTANAATACSSSFPFSSR